VRGAQPPEPEHAAFIIHAAAVPGAQRGYRFACGMMPPARAMMGLFGLQLEILGPERTYWNESRAPVRFSLMSDQAAGGSQDQLAEPRPDEHGVGATEAEGIDSWPAAPAKADDAVEAGADGRRPATGDQPMQGDQAHDRLHRPDPAIMWPVEPLTAMTGG
jgi:hypothetical protein